MMHRAWSSIVQVLYCFSRSYFKLQGHTAKKIIDFDPKWVFPDCNSSLNSPMAMKCCTKLETAKERCSIVFQGHPSNFKVTRYKTSLILTQIGCFQTIGRSQLSNPSDLPCLLVYINEIRAWINKYIQSFVWDAIARPYLKSNYLLSLSCQIHHLNFLLNLIPCCMEPYCNQTCL